MKYCRTCDLHKTIENFSDKISSTTGKESQCKVCRAKYQRIYRNTSKGKLANKNGYQKWRKSYPWKKCLKEANRRAYILKRTPTWANLDKIRMIYKNCPEGYHVDHIVPLKGRLVSGLHIDYNLQYLSAKDNISKGNRF